MIFQYGSYSHPIDEVALVVTREALRNAAGEIYAHHTRFDLTGFLQVDEGATEAITQASMTAAIQALETAYRQPNRDARLLLNDGSTSSAHTLLAAQTLGGVRIAKPVSFPVGDGGEYSTFRRFTVSLEADVVANSMTTMLVEFSEVLRVSGNGGPRRVVIETRYGPPVEQIVSQRTPVLATQSGRAVGLLSYPTAPPPLWPKYIDGTRTDIQEESPQRVGPAGSTNPFINFPLTWTYQFISPGPLAGHPTRWT